MWNNKKHFSLTNHPNYNNKSNLNDIAVLKLAQKLTFSNKVRPACLPFDEKFQMEDATSLNNVIYI